MQLILIAFPVVFYREILDAFVVFKSSEGGLLPSPFVFLKSLGKASLVLVFIFPIVWLMTLKSENSYEKKLISISLMSLVFYILLSCYMGLLISGLIRENLDQKKYIKNSVIDEVNTRANQ